MAKVTGPLFSMSASGTLGNALVFSGWKGVKYVRQHVIPANPQSEDQGDARMILGGLAKACAPILPAGTFGTRLVPLIPAGQSWISYCIKYMRDNIMPDATAFEAVITAVGAHSATSDWDDAADDCPLFDFDISYKGTTNDFEKGAQLYVIALLGVALGFTTSPFDTALASWTDTEIDALVTEMTS